jgi:hypothetical protein
VLGRENFAGEEDDPESRQIPLLEFAAGLEKREHHRNGVPDSDFLVLDERGKLQRKNSQALGHQRDRGTGGDCNEQIENREIEIERGVV